MLLLVSLQLSLVLKHLVKNKDTIIDINKIRKICQSVETVYPECIKSDLLNIVDGSYELKYPYTYQDKSLNLPEEMKKPKGIKFTDEKK